MLLNQFDVTSFLINVLTFLIGLNSLDMEAMWLRISEDHNCDTFYFNLVESLTSFMEIWKTIFRLDAWK